MPDARTAPARPAFAVFDGLAAELDDAPLPPEADSVLRAANERRAAPAESPRLGLALRGLQAAFPMTGAPFPYPHSFSLSDGFESQLLMQFTSVSAVPEPGTLAALAVGAACLLAGRHFA